MQIAVTNVHQRNHLPDRNIRGEDWIPAMLQKCANPGCTVPFHSLREGKLFLAETYVLDVESGFDGSRRKIRKREHFWLCAACSSHFTLHYDESLGMLTIPISDRSSRAMPSARAACANNG